MIYINGKRYHVHVLEDYIVNVSILSKLICTFNSIPIKNHRKIFFCKYKQDYSKIYIELFLGLWLRLSVKFIMKGKVTRITKTILKNKKEGINILDLKTYLIAVLI